MLDVRTHARTHARTLDACAHARMHTRMHVRKHARARARTYARMHAPMHTCSHGHSHACMHIYAHTFTRAHTCSHTNIMHGCARMSTCPPPPSPTCRAPHGTRICSQAGVRPPAVLLLLEAARWVVGLCTKPRLLGFWGVARQVFGFH